MRLRCSFVGRHALAAGIGTLRTSFALQEREHSQVAKVIRTAGACDAFVLAKTEKRTLEGREEGVEWRL